MAGLPNIDNTTVNINLQMGALSELSDSSISAGTIYFAIDTARTGFGELYFDDIYENKRIKIAPKLSSVTFNAGTSTNPEFYINVEDGSKITASMPVAGESQWGVITTGNQDFSGIKKFNEIKIANNSTGHRIYNNSSNKLVMDIANGIIINTTLSSTIDTLNLGSLSFSVEGATTSEHSYDLSIDQDGFYVSGKNREDTFSLSITSDGLNTDTITATSISATTFAGALSGNASTASKLQTPVNINGTAFDGSTAITTQAWGMERTISIDDEAGTTGTKTTGAANITLVIPATMTGFTSITSTTLLATNIGTASNRIGAIRPNSIVLYQSGYTGGTTIARDAANTTAYTLHLPSASGRLVYHTKDTAIGSANIPVYISSTGQATACGAVNVAHGGTGQTTLTSGYALIGNGTNAVSLRAITNITTAGTITSNTNLITANTLNNWKGTSNIVTVGTISSGTWQGTSIKVGYGGTGTTTAPTKGGVIYASSTSAYASTAAGTSGYLLQSGGSDAPSWINATNSNTANTVVKRDASGNFSAGTITASLSGNASTASAWQTAIVFDGMSLKGDASRYSYSTCSTAASTVAKVAACTGFTLASGSEITVKFTYGNTATNPTLNVNSTGAKSIYYRGAAIPSTYIIANGTYTFRYNGTQYDLVGDINTQSNTDNSKKDAVQCSTAGGTAAKVGTAAAYNLSNNRYFFVLMENANSYRGSITLNINSTGAKTIYINGSASSSSNYTLPAGLYLVYYDGTYYRFRTSTFLDGCFTRSYVNTTTSNTNYYLIGASGTGDTSLYRAYNSSGTANTNGCYFNGYSGVLYGAAWNDYAEFRQCKEQFVPGNVVFENGDDTLSISTKRMQRGCSIVSDTYGFAIGETEKAKCPIAVSGRVLAIPYESLEKFKNHIGYAVCSGPDGTVSVMTEEEERNYPTCIIGTISAVPEYETWGPNDIKVNNRVWIKIK